MIDNDHTYPPAYYDACYMVTEPARDTKQTERESPDIFQRKLDSSTSHIAVVDPNGIAVSVTSTVNGPFGSMVKGNRTGILFNNEMDDFSSPAVANLYQIAPSPKNFVQPGKRPTSSMSPTIAFNRRSRSIELLVGAEGKSLQKFIYLKIESACTVQYMYAYPCTCTVHVPYMTIVHVPVQCTIVKYKYCALCICTTILVHL